MAEFTHFDSSGATHMVNVGDKPATQRAARARAVVRMQRATAAKIVAHGFAKGNVLEVARLAGIMAAKRTSELIPLCHVLPLDAVSLDLAFDQQGLLVIESQVRVFARTGVEMEALTAVTVAALTVYDMCKSVDRGLTIEQVCLLEKSGGSSGHFLREAAATE